MDGPSENLLTSWSTNAASWTDAIRSRRIASRRDVTDASIVEAVLRQSPRRLLDVGCGEGWLCRALSGQVADIVGIDGSPELVARAEEKGGASFQCIDYAHLIATPDEVGEDFDAIVCNFALLDDRTGALLSALSQIAAPGAQLVIQTLHPLHVSPPYADGWRVERFEGFGDGGWAEMPWFFHTLSTWIALISTDWRLIALEEPRATPDALPASLLLVAETRLAAV
jgi:2-polyprenyl-3-methyl-5-hydroxy-6-metoxy-1,4-benzoquinol methylase